MNRGVWILTGGIASGKSEVARYFKYRGYDTFNCDEYSKVCRQFKHNEIEKRFGTTDPATLRRLIFLDEPSKRDLEDMIVPMVISELEKKIQYAGPNMIVEMPTYDGKYKPMHFAGVISVEAPMDHRIKRLMDRDHIDGFLACRIIAQQPSDDDRRRSADVVFKNNWDIDALKHQADIFIDTVDCLSE